MGRRRQPVHRLPRRLRRRASRATPTRASSRPSAGPRRRARTSPRRPRWSSRWPRSCAGASSSTRCASPTRAPRRPWTRSASPEPPPVATRWSRSRARTTAITTRSCSRCCPTPSRSAAGTCRPPRPMSSGIPADMAAAHLRRAVQRRGRLRGAAGRAVGRDRLPHPRAGDDEHRHRRARAGVPPGAEGPLRPPRRRPHLRRGEVGRDRRRGRSRPALRRAPAPRLLRQGAVRRHARRGLRR